MSVKLRFWRLQEVEVPLRKGVDLKEAIDAIIENDSLFDTDDLNWDKEEVVSEDYSGTTDRFGIMVNDELINSDAYSLSGCDTFRYVDKEDWQWQNRLVKYLDRVIREKYEKEPMRRFAEEFNK